MKSPATAIAFALFVVNTLSANPFQAQTTQEKVEAQGTLKLGETQQRTLAHGTIHVWSLALEKGQYVTVEVLEKSLNVAIRIVNPKGVKHLEFDNPSHIWENEKACWIADTTGIWNVEIASSQTTILGDYDIKLSTLHEATANDWQTAKADSFDALAMFYYAQGNFAKAEFLSQHCLAIREKTFGQDHPEVAGALNILAELCFYQSKYNEAEPLCKRSLMIREKSLGLEHLEVAQSLNNLASLYLEQGKYIEAEPLFLQSLMIKEKTSGPDHPDMALFLNSFASLYLKQGKYSRAEQLYKRAFNIGEKSIGVEHPAVFMCLHNLAALYDDQGKYVDAESLLKKVYLIEEKVLGPSHPYLAMTLSNLAGVYRVQNRYAEAEPLYIRSLAITQKALGINHIEMATILHNLAILYRSQGKFAEAESLVKQAMEIQKMVLGQDHPDVTVSMVNLAQLFRQYERYDEAESLVQRSLEIRAKTLGLEHLQVANALKALAFVHFDQGEYAEAALLFQRALALQENQMGFSHPETAVLLSSLVKAILLEDEKKIDVALPLIERAIGIFDAVEGVLYEKAKAYALRAWMRKQSGDTQRAVSDLNEALRLTEKLRPQFGAGEETRAIFLAQNKDEFDLMVSWQVEAKEIEQALKFAERGRARVLLDLLASAQLDVRQAIPSEQRAPLEHRETDSKARIAELQQRLRLLPPRKDLSEEGKNREIADLKDSLRVAEQVFQQVYEEIKYASPLWRDLITSGGQPVALDTIQARLVPKNGLMLFYQIGKDGSYLFVIPPAGQKPEVISLQVPDQVASILEVEIGPLKSTALQRILVGQDTTKSGQGLLHYFRSRGTDATQTKFASAKLQALWQVLVPASLWSRLVASSEVIIIPDGALNLLPFEALVVQTGSKPSQTRYWLDEGPVIRYAPSATTLYNLEQRQVSSSVTSTSALSLSDPIFDPKAVAQAMQQQSAKKLAASHDSSQAIVEDLDSFSVFAATRGTFERASGALLRLEATARETEEIRQAFGKKSVIALMRLDANEPRLRAELAGRRYLHLATHGVVDQQRSVMFAALALTPPPNETNVAENDGFLQLYEIYDLKLPDCELAVLSACQTNFGRYFEGEGVFALSRGFLAAGAARVVASHWDVDDKSTSELIGAFFRQIAADERSDRKIEYAHALREAKRKVRDQEQWTAPYYWAPFVLTGKR